MVAWVRGTVLVIATCYSPAAALCADLGASRSARAAVGGMGSSHAASVLGGSTAAIAGARDQIPTSLALSLQILLFLFLPMVQP